MARRERINSRQPTREEVQIIRQYQDDWNRFAREILGVRLDPDQQRILSAIQTSRKVAVSSGHARGKDYVAAVAGISFLYLYSPSKVICTAPTGRQVTAIMMSEISRIHNQARIPLGGELLQNMIKLPKDPDWYLIGFKASDRQVEDWSGFHSSNIMVIATEASGLEQETFDAIEGLLTGNSRLLIVFNPNRITGYTYKAMRSPEFVKFRLSSLDAPNVKAKRIIYPGQVDWQWINERVDKPGWTMPIKAEEADSTKHDFQWEGRWYRPGHLFLVKAMGEFPPEGSDTLIPFSWLEAANDRWLKMRDNPPAGLLRLGVDVAGMGSDNTVFSPRREKYVEPFEVMPMPSVPAKIHMATAGAIKNRIAGGGLALIDTVGEGAGVFSRLIELAVPGAISVKGSESAKGLTDLTGERTFANMRAYLHWAVRDALDPAFGFNLAIPPCPELEEEISAIKFTTKSNGQILIKAKSEIKMELGRSPDFFDALANTFYPVEIMPESAMDEDVLVEGNVLD